MNLFIDTNIYLNFYNLSNEDLNELAKLQILQKDEEINIFLPQQVENEFLRNREGTIKNALQQFKEDSLKEKIPNMAKTYDDYAELEKAKNHYADAKRKILAQMEDDIVNKSLQADNLIENVFNLSIKIPISKNIYNDALIRHTLGNPPGKKDSIGDAVNWESLVYEFSKRSYGDKSLYIISSDGDFQSELDDSKLKPYLLNEWYKLFESNISFFKRISLFTKEFYPNINISIESDKQSVIENWVNSGSYKTTHQIVDELSKFESFSLNQAYIILKAAYNNQQIFKILNDEDVSTFVIYLLTNYGDELDNLLIYSICQSLNPVTEDEYLVNQAQFLKNRHSIPF